jgi:class 3 adenylate cyclase
VSTRVGRFGLKPLLEELLLYSGQFGLFYLVMQGIVQGRDFLGDFGHLGLVAALLVQAAVLAAFGDRPAVRIPFSFFVPAFYSLLESREGAAYIWNVAHLGFWAYALASAVLMSLRRPGGGLVSRAAEDLLVGINVLIFVFLYFYFDTLREVGDSGALTIAAIPGYMPGFLSDPTHWFVIAGGFVLAVTVALGRHEVARLKERIYALFGAYVDGRVRDEIIRDGRAVSRRSELCVLFSDIVSFTSLCERNDPDSITRMLNVYFERWERIVSRHGGTIDKYIGDALMVIFGLDDPEGACDAAVRASLEMNEGWDALKAELADKGLPVPAGFGIGCHYGELIVGDIGGSARRNFTVIGDTVNVAARLESATRKAGTNLLLSSDLRSRLSEDLGERFSRLGMLGLKGKERRIEVWGLDRA